MCTAVRGWCVFVLGKDKAARLEMLIFQSRCFSCRVNTKCQNVTYYVNYHKDNLFCCLLNLPLGFILF
jgi:hypothetical protein